MICPTCSGEAAIQYADRFREILYCNNCGWFRSVMAGSVHDTVPTVVAVTVALDNVLLAVEDKPHGYMLPEKLRRALGAARKALDVYQGKETK